MPLCKCISMIICWRKQAVRRYRGKKSKSKCTRSYLEVLRLILRISFTMLYRWSGFRNGKRTLESRQGQRAKWRDWMKHKTQLLARLTISNSWESCATWTRTNLTLWSFVMIFTITYSSEMEFRRMLVSLFYLMKCFNTSILFMEAPIFADFPSKFSLPSKSNKLSSSQTSKTIKLQISTSI